MKKRSFRFGRVLLSRPNFYLSEYLEANRSEYYDRMLAVSRDDDWSGWVAFFLRGIIAQADANTKKAQIPAATARKLVRDFRDHGILRELVPASGRAPATLVFSELLNIAEGRNAFCPSW